MELGPRTKEETQRLRDIFEGEFCDQMSGGQCVSVVGRWISTHEILVMWASARRLLQLTPTPSTRFVEPEMSKFEAVLGCCPFSAEIIC